MYQAGFSRTFRSAADVRIHKSDDEFNGTLSVEIGPYSIPAQYGGVISQNRSAGVTTIIGNRFDTSVYNFVNYSMDLWFPAFERKITNEDAFMTPSQPIQYHIYTMYQNRQYSFH